MLVRHDVAASLARDARIGDEGVDVLEPGKPDGRIQANLGRVRQQDVLLRALEHGALDGGLLHLEGGEALLD